MINLVKSDWYSKTWYNRDKLFVYNITQKIVLNWLKNNQGKLIDLGCGYGIFTKRLAKNTKFKITAIDYDKKNIELSNKILKKVNVKVKQENVLNMNFSDDYFDVAISTGYTSAATLPGAIREVKRIVRPNGLIILDYMRFYNIYYLFSGNFFKRLFNFIKKKDNQYYFGKFGLKKYLQKENNLVIEDIKSFYTYPPFFKSKKLAILFENTIGILFKPFLARVIILKLRNIK